MGAAEEGREVAGEPPGPGAADSEEPFDPWEVDEGLETWQRPGSTLGPLGQLAAALVLVFVVGLTLLGTVAVLSWLFG
jgi:hypothetical protein